MGHILIAVSWFLRTYGAIQEQRDVLQKPLIWHSNAMKMVLILLWIALLAIGSFIIYSNDGFLVLVIILLVYFVIAPTFVAPLLKKILDKYGF